MPIYVGVNGEAKAVTETYINNKNNYLFPNYLSNNIPNIFIPINHIFSFRSFEGIDTGILYTEYTKIIITFLPNTFKESFGNTIICNENETIARYEISTSHNYCYPVLRIPDVLNSNNSLKINMPYITDLNSIPTDYCTFIINKNSNRESYIKINNEEEILLGASTSELYNNYKIKLLSFPYLPICYCAIYQNLLVNTTPTREYFPCMEKSTCKAGFYETIEGKFYTSNNFSAGPFIEEYNLPIFN